MRRALVLIVILLAAIMLVACGKDDELSQSPAKTTAGTATTATTPSATATVQKRTTNDGCKAVAPPQPAENPDRKRSKKRLSSKRRHTAVVKTNCGTFEIRLAVDRAPKTTSSFAGLARGRFFEGLTFHRIAKPGGNDFVVQGGDPLGTGNGGPGYSVVEPPPKSISYDQWTVAMAKTQAEKPGTSGSQFFVVTAEQAPLPAEYALLGTVVEGRGVVRRIAAVPTDPATETPIDPVVISSLRIKSSGSK